MGNSFGLGGLGWFFVPAPLAKPAFVAQSAKVTLDSAKNLGSAKTPGEKASGLFQFQHNAKSLKRRLFGYNSKKPNNISLSGTGRGKPIISMSEKEKQTEKEDERQLAKNILSGKFANKLRNQQGPKLPPIKPKGEFATIPFFSETMKKFRIEDVTRENFIDKFIDGIIANTENNYAFAIESLNLFKAQIDKMTIPHVRVCKREISKIEEEIKSYQEYINQNKNNYNQKIKEQGNKYKENMGNIVELGIRNKEEKIKELQNKKKIEEGKKKAYETFLKKFANSPKNKRENEIKKKFNLGDSKDFEINLFLTKNYWEFHTKITDKIKELRKKFDEQ